MEPDSLDPLVDRLPSRFVVGVDLGTTNSAAAYVDTSESPWRVATFSIPQFVAPGVVESRETLPSFLYQPAAGEWSDESLALPWASRSRAGASSSSRPSATAMKGPNEREVAGENAGSRNASSRRTGDRAAPQPPIGIVGVMAREEGTTKPARLIASAKSWLCHSGVDRTAELLPWQGASDVERMSPIDASARYLRHIHDAWNDRFPDDPLAEQEIVLTLPASFDEVARELTIEAARRAGLRRVVLIEEPQAAFYAWVYKHADDWDQRVSPGQSILVCDIGGGTSDFTLIRVRRSEDANQPVQFHRVAVGEHLILGGDNLDLALARHLEQKLVGDGKLTSHQWQVLVRRCRRAKETLLGDDPPDELTVSLPSGGSRMIGSASQVTVTREETERLLVDGFLPPAPLDARPIALRSGFQEFGLPFAPDPAITRYLASFLTTHRDLGAREERLDPQADPARPDIVLFNGGFFASPALRTRLIESLANWFPSDAIGRGEGDASRDRTPWSPIVLDHDRLDLAVARGAAYYGMVRRGEGVKIAARLARSYYMQIDADPPAAVCIAPGDAEAGEDIELTEQAFELALAEPVEFPLLVSSTRLTDRPGEIVTIDREQMTPLPPIRTVVKTGGRKHAETVRVRLHTRLTEIGTLDLWCSEIWPGEAHDASRQADRPARRWRLQFDVRSATQTDIAAHESAAESEGVVEESLWVACERTLDAAFGAPAHDEMNADAPSESPDQLMKRLIESIDSPREEWPTSLLRRIWEATLDRGDGRKRSAAHEARWLNLLGYSLRPGYGLAVDDWRVAETWRAVQGRLAFNTPAVRNESFVLWRRLAGGLSRGQQQAIAEPLLSPVRALAKRHATGKGRSPDASIDPGETPEIWRLLGSLELLPIGLKNELGGMIVSLLGKKKLAKVQPAMTWALGRLGQRVPVYGPLNTIVPRERAAEWLDALLQLDLDDRAARLAVMQVARCTGDRHRDLDDAARREAADWLERRGAPPHYAALVLQTGQLADDEQNEVVGEALPKGLRIV